MNEAYPEHPFAKGEELTEVASMRLGFKNLNEEHPQSRYPMIHQTLGDGTVATLELSPAEGRWLADALTRMFRD